MEEKEFKDWLSQYTDAESAFSSLQSIKESFRVNTLKIPVSIFDEVSQIDCDKIKWLDCARVPKNQIPLGKTFEYFLGYIHPQSLSSMVPPLVLDPQPGERILDLTAAPGSKTTQISAMMGNQGAVIANDEEEREIFIVNNISRLGAINVLITIRDAKSWPLKGIFDRVLLDAPCSALGSNLNAIRRFSPDSVYKISSVQKRMIISAFDALKVGGTLVYSTCTYSKEENEDVISHLLNLREEAKQQKIGLNAPHELSTDKYSWRIYPQHLGSEGFFVSKIVKTER